MILYLRELKYKSIKLSVMRKVLTCLKQTTLIEKYISIIFTQITSNNNHLDFQNSQL
jgi:hypothetical protein